MCFPHVSKMKTLISQEGMGWGLVETLKGWTRENSSRITSAKTVRTQFGPDPPVNTLDIL